MVRVSDGKNAGGIADTSIDDTIQVTITVTNVNEPPEFDSSDVEHEIDENTPAGTNIGDPIVATDPESPVLTYPLAGVNYDEFDIDTVSGQIKTKTLLDHESQPEFGLTVTATDSGDLAVSIEITVTVTDVDTEAPGKPAKPSVVPNPGNGHKALKVTWTNPENADPVITGYVVQYRIDESVDDCTPVTVAANINETTNSGLESTTVPMCRTVRVSDTPNTVSITLPTGTSSVTLVSASLRLNDTTTKIYTIRRSYSRRRLLSIASDPLLIKN